MALYENMQAESVSRLAIRTPVTAPPNATLRAAVEAMREQKLGCVIVVDDEHRPVGMLTESMLTRLIANDPSVLDEPLSSEMAERWPWVDVNDRVVDVLGAIELKNVRFLCYVDETGKLLGLTGQKGLIEYVADHFPAQVMVQRIGNTPYTKQREGA